jgi:hypothetical protein
MVRARILWPALGFPAVISPRDKPPTGALAADGDATRCICVLLLSNQRFLSKADAARCLRFVPWDERGRRHIRPREAGSFLEEELSVRNGEASPGLSMPHPKDRLGEVVVFGADRDGKNGIVASLSLRVREFYRQHGLRYLHEIRIYERAMSRLTGPLYHLFWNNESPAADVPSDEMALLLSKFAPSRRADVGPSLREQRSHLAGEYEFEYGSLPGGARVRSEILHPVFVQRQLGSVLRVGHVTDTHVDVRHDVYEENLKHSTFRNLTFNNWNKSFVDVYEKAKTDADVILLTGDLIDYGRGHLGVSARAQLGQDAYYHVDRNWFLFYRLLASGKSYTRPVYTILGNHDWRLNPYTPLAIAGAPDPTELFHHMSEAKGPGKERQRDALRAAHGPGHSRIISYVLDIEKKWQTLARSSTLGKLLKTVFLGSQTADIKKYPTETTVESVEWYLQTINPFLDYWFARPHGQQVLMLDWAEDETVMFPEVTHGRRHGLNLKWLVAGKPGSEGPKARNCLTDLQWWFVKRFVEESGRAKIIGIHAPPIGPWADWSDDEMLRGVKTYPPDVTPRGATGYMTRVKGGGTRPWNGHPLFAIRPAQEKSSDQVFGMDASYNSFEKKRPEFIRAVAAARSGVRLVLSGHIHRNGLFAVYQADNARGSLLKGQWLLQYLVRQAAEGVTPPAVSKSPLIGEKGHRFASGPLYVNTTSAGPRGNDFSRLGSYRRADPGFAHVDLAADGTIQRIEFRKIEPPAASTTVAPPPSRPVTVPTGAPRVAVGGRGR